MRIDSLTRPVGWSWPIGIVALVGLWLLARPYSGVRHDGVLYLGQIYLQLDPTVFARDLFFAFGSQDRYTLFSRLGSWAHAALGLERSQFLILLFGHVLLLVATAWLLKALVSVPQRVLGLIALAVMPHFYGGMGIFSFAETFVTARTLAEPLGVLALACLVHGHRLWAFTAVLASALMHPLMALPVLAIGWVFLMLTDRRWAWLLVPIAGVVAGLVAIGFGPFGNLARRYDPDWLAIVRQTNSFVLPLTWSLGSWALTLAVLGFLHVSAGVLPPVLGKLARSVAWTGALLLSLSIVGGDILANILLTQLQLWRVLWVAHLVALALLPAVLLRLLTFGGAWPTAAAGILAAAVALTAEWTTSPIVLAWALGLCLLAKAHPSVVQAREWRLLRHASLAVLVLISVLLTASNLRQLTSKGVDLDLSVILWALSTTPVLMLAAGAYALARGQRWSRPRLLGLTLAAAMMVIGGSQWDRRTDTQRIIEARPAVAHPFALKIAPQSQVYWRDSLNHTWAMLGRVSYFTDHQGSGVLFERKTALEFERRRQLFSKLSFQREICMMLAGLEQNAGWNEECVPDLELLTEVCRAERGPDYLVFPFKLAVGAIESWTLSPGDAPSTTFHLHDCAQLR